MRIVRTLLIVCLGVVFAGPIACANSDNGQSSRQDASTVVIVSGDGVHTFTVELADDDEERRIGLMYRTEMAQDAGMLFDFEHSQPISMWMKNTLIPLDMAFIDENGVIRQIVANTQPRSLQAITSRQPVLAVLEVNGGVFAELGVKPGDQVRHPIFERARER